MAILLKGLPVANALTEKLIEKCKTLKQNGVVPTLAIVRVGEREDDISYERGALKRCEKIGIAVKQFILSTDASEKEVLDTIVSINKDSSIHGCLMFRPLADKGIEEKVCSLLSPSKDVDCMTSGSLAGVFSGSGEGFPPCTAQAVVELLKHYDISLEGKNVVVIGRSLVIGKPVSIMLQSENATVTMCHTRTRDLSNVCKSADILVVAAGRFGVVDETFVSKDQIVIDVGINVDDEGNLCGDVNFDKVEPVVSAISPVPGGVGSVTTAVLAKHVIKAAEALS